MKDRPVQEQQRIGDSTAQTGFGQPLLETPGPQVVDAAQPVGRLGVGDATLGERETQGLVVHHQLDVDTDVTR